MGKSRWIDPSSAGDRFLLCTGDIFFSLSDHWSLINLIQVFCELVWEVHAVYVPWTLHIDGPLAFGKGVPHLLVFSDTINKGHHHGVYHH